MNLGEEEEEGQSVTVKPTRLPIPIEVPADPAPLTEPIEVPNWPQPATVPEEAPVIWPFTVPAKTGG